MAELKRILVVRTDRLGDVVLTLPSCVALKAANPWAELLFLCRSYAQPLVGLCEAVDGAVIYDPEGRHKGLAGVLRLAGELRKLRVELAILFYPRPALALALFLAGIPLRVGTGRRWYSFLLNRRVQMSRRGSGIHELELNLELVRSFLGSLPAPKEVSFGITIPYALKRDASLKLAELGVTGPYAIIHPGSGGSAPSLPPDMFSKMAAELADSHAMTVLVAGTAQEAELVGKVVTLAEENPRVVALTGLPLELYAAVIAGARFFSANSTGPLHIARALNVPVLGFYCSATALAPDRWGPYDRPESAMVPHIPPCPRCDRGKCEHVNCLELLKWAEIRGRMGKILQKA